MKSYPDSYLHFENLESPETQEFAAAAHAETRVRFLENDKARALSDGILAQLQDTRQIPFCQEHRARMYHFHQDAEYPKGVYRVCTAATYRSGYPEWKILFSVADFDELLGDDVYLGGVSHLVEKPNRALLTLSKSGGDTAYTLEVDLEAGELVEGGFHFPAGKNHVSWRDENSVWVCPAWDERQLTESGYPREVWLVERGKSFEESLPVYQIAEDGMMVNAWRYLDPQGSPIDLIEASDGFYTKTYFAGVSRRRGETVEPAQRLRCGRLSSRTSFADAAQRLEPRESKLSEWRIGGSKIKPRRIGRGAAFVCAR